MEQVKNQFHQELALGETAFFAACQYLQSLSQEYTQRTNQNKKRQKTLQFIFSFCN